jgi:hypothetical protein
MPKFQEELPRNDGSALDLDALGEVGPPCDGGTFN